MSMSTPTPSDSPPRGPIEAVLRANDLSDPGLRLGIAAALGESGFEERDRYDAFGWEADPESEEYVGLYLRNPYGGGLIDKAAQLAWRHDPVVDEAGDGAPDESAFETAVGKLARAHSLWAYCARVHKAAGFGEYALLFINFDDVDDLDNLDTQPDFEDGDLDNIRGFRVVPQMAVDEVEHGDFNSSRWGDPEYYTIDWGDDLNDDLDDDAGASRVHHSRVVEVPSKPPIAEEYSSRPRMERILNTLYDIEKLLGSAAEMSYRGADKGLHINYDPTKVNPETLDTEEERENIQRWLHGLQPTFNTVGAEVNDLGGEIRDPTGALEAELKSLSAATGFSKQFIEGAAAGEIASSETNMRNDFGEIRERQTQYVTPYIVRRALGTLQAAGVLPRPASGEYDVTWPDLFELSDSEEAEIEQKRAQVAKAIGLMGDAAQEYIKTGEFPDDEVAMPAMDESDPAVANQFQAITGDTASAGSEQTSNESTTTLADVDLTPPEAARSNAQRVLDWRADDDTDVTGMTETGWGTAETLASGEELTPEKVQEVAAWFARHPPSEADLNDGVEEPWRDNGRVAILGWGGETMRDWVAGKRTRLAEIDVLEPVANANHDLSDIVTGNATRYSEGDTVSTPQGVGVVTAVTTEPIESDDVDDIDASPDSPTYMVVVEDARVGADFYKAGDLHSTEIQTDVDPTESLADDQTSNAVVGAILDTLTANDFSPPQSWRQSETPARIIALDAFASMGASFDGCVREMRGSVTSPDRFCGSFLDYVIGNGYWRGDSPLPGD